ncbi:glycosyl hydrolase family 115 (putative glucuronidase) [Prolixibacter denitrificans]|uniref:Glycosyl hydrolase family 115 (Putative glucuronidase) n=2 Tax=Prolixibacter denitrificans TaxID=1541063 RepID=A0A2P8C661_9BACT|nr:glycosyl hydrolase family 115 (putative glucuronidase) [Prolixibacter denitrificans]
MFESGKMRKLLSRSLWGTLLGVGLLLQSCQSKVAPKENNQPTHNYISTTQVDNGFTLARDGKTAPIVIGSDDYKGVKLIAGFVQNDLQKVTQTKPMLVVGDIPKAREIILAGTVGRSSLIQHLIEKHKIDVSDIKGKWEATVTQVVDNPFPGVKKALVIAGSDKRGTIYGLFDLSRNIGVSPWNWWADVPVPVRTAVYVKQGRYLVDSPKVKYRGIFLNDEEPALGRWAVANYGGFNHKFYEKVFELLLRLRGNYMWPAMWWASFNSDDPENPKLADEMGIVMGTSHHEPMMRAHAEWAPYRKKGIPWDYTKSKAVLDTFWTKGIERMDHHESIVTVGMRGDGDEAMGDKTNIALLERIVADQRKIIEKVTGKPAKDTPQLWALYKEVQAYYDQGMRVPDDVTLLLCDDNWGNIRKLPKLDAKPRSGGYGIYYHFDYVGGPRNYKWLNTNPLPRVWEQMHLAYKHGVDRIWLVNVGDLKPIELPISFFLDYAWNPDAMPKEKLPEYTTQWAAQQFGTEHAKEIGRMLQLYAKYNGRRKPELLSPETYSLNHYQEYERVVNEYSQLAREAEELGHKMPPKYKDAYYELVEHPITACANLNAMYYAAAKNHQAFGRGSAMTNDWGDSVKARFEEDSLITVYYHTKLADGKWNHMMAQTHIGYTYWQEPKYNRMPKLDDLTLPEKAQMGVAIQGADTFLTEGTFAAELPEMDNFNRKPVYIDVFNRGKEPFKYKITTAQPWLKVEAESGTVQQNQRIWLSADWNKVPEGKHTVAVEIQQEGGKTITVNAVVEHLTQPNPTTFNGFIESNGYVSMEAAHCTRNIPANRIQWEEIPGLGRTLSAMSPFPVTANKQTPGSDGPHMEYDMYLYQSGTAKVNLYLSPTLNFYNDNGLQLAVSFDDQKPVVINMNKDENYRNWASWVSNEINIQQVSLPVERPGKHTLKVWMIDPAVVLQKIVVDAGGEKTSYLGPPESARLE